MTTEMMVAPPASTYQTIAEEVSGFLWSVQPLLSVFNYYTDHGGGGGAVGGEEYNNNEKLDECNKALALPPWRPPAPPLLPPPHHIPPGSFSFLLIPLIILLILLLILPLILLPCHHSFQIRRTRWLSLLFLLLPKPNSDSDAAPDDSLSVHFF